MKKIKSIRHNWKYSEIKKLFDLPFNDLLYKSQGIHRRNFKNIFKYAAIISISVAVGYYNQMRKGVTDENKVVLDPKKVTLQTSSGNQIVLENLDDILIEIDDEILIKKESKW